MKSMLSKALVLAVICLFIGAVVIPSISGNNNSNGPPSIEWEKTFGGELVDGGYDVVQTDDGGFIVAASKDTIQQLEGGDCWLIKTDMYGNLEWEKTYGGDLNDEGWNVQQTKDGGYGVCGVTTSYQAELHDAYFVKTDENGNMQWEQTYGGSGPDTAYRFQETADNGYVFVGSWDLRINGDIGDVWLVKTDENGNMQWQKTYGGSRMEIGYYVQQTNDFGYLISSATSSYGAGSLDGWLIKTDEEGNIEWEETYGGQYSDSLTFFEETTDGGYIATGHTCSFGDKDGDLWIVKIDELGNKQWTKIYGGDSYDYGYSIKKTSDNGYIILGSTDSYGAGDSDFYLIKIDAFGNKLWEMVLGGEDRDAGRGIQQTTDGGYIVVGHTLSFGAGEKDVWLIKLAPEYTGPISIEIHGGFRVSAVITNTGGETITDIPWSIDLEGGLILAGIHTEGVIGELAPSASKTIRQTTLYGIGRTTITVTVGDTSEQATGFILGPLVLGVEEIS